ncbi:19189_t:CDS:2, partial [Racocetra persica]
IQEELPTVPPNLSELFKNDLVYFIHRQLSNGLANSGKKTVSVACKGKHKLNQIFGRLDWGIKYYDQNQITYIVFDNDQSLESCQNSEINPLAVATAKRSKKKKFKYGEVVVEWKRRYDKDASGNICSADMLAIINLKERKSVADLE